MIKNKISKEEIEATLAQCTVVTLMINGKAEPCAILKVDNNVLKIHAKSKFHIMDYAEVTATFVYSRAQIETVGRLQYEGENNYKITFDSDFFKIQRRENFRTNLPGSWKCVIDIFAVNGQRLKAQAGLRDISLKGCLFAKLIGCELNADDEIQAFLRVSDFADIEVVAKVRRAVNQGANRSYGVEFIEIKDMGAATLNSITLSAARHSIS